MRREIQIASVLGLAHGVTTIDQPERDPPPLPVDEFGGGMLRSAPPKPRSGVDRVFDALFDRVPTGSGQVTARQPYVPHHRPKARRTVHRADVMLLAQAKYISSGDRAIVPSVLRSIGGSICGKNRRHRVYRMARAVERGN